jgi:phospholipase C
MSIPPGLPCVQMFSGKVASAGEETRTAGQAVVSKMTASTRGKASEVFPNHPMNPQQHPTDPVKHVVLLMFENHSFDQMLGCFKAAYLALDGVDPKNPGVNLVNGKPFAQAVTTERQMLLDPRHEVNHVEAQMADHNGGFVADFVGANPKSAQEQRQFVMGYYPG